MPKQLSNKQDIGLSLILLFISAILISYKFGAHTIYMWDEAIYANNALEMAHSGHWWVIQNDGLPSHYNVKPPLAIWLQSFMIKLFGPHEWAIRWPSILAGFGIFSLLIFYAKKWTGRMLPGAIATLVLATCLGFNRPHVIRSADLDAITLLFTTWYSFLFVDFLWRGKYGKRFYVQLVLLVYLGFLSKSLAGLMPLMPLFILSLFNENGRKFLLAKKTWISIVIGLFVIGIFYFFRNLIQPGYFDLVWHSEFLRFTHNIMEWHKQPYYFYILNMWRFDYFFPNMFLLIFPIIALIKGHIEKDKELLKILGACSIIFLIFISIPSVKLQWYDAHLYPIFAMLIGLSTTFLASKRWRQLSTAIIISVCFFAGIGIIKKYQNSKSTDPFEYPGEMIRSLAKTQPQHKNYVVLMQVQTPEHLDQVKFYQKGSNWYKKGYDITLAERADQLEDGQVILCCQNESIAEVEKIYEMEEIEKTQQCYFFKINQQ